jgi:probable HAF family extracellular repeat protein
MTKFVGTKKAVVMFVPLLCLLLFTATVFAAPTYTVTDLGTLGGTYSYAYGINQLGQVVGYSEISGGAGYHGFLYDGTAMRDLGALGGSYSYAYGINNSGQAVGYSEVGDGTGYQAFLYTGGAMEDLNTGGILSVAYGINDSGLIVGSSLTMDKGLQAFLDVGGTMRDLSIQAGSQSEALAVNNSGQVVGWSGIGGGAGYHAFLYDGTAMHDLGTLGGTNSYALGLNNPGQVVGWSEIAGGTAHHAFLYDGAGLRDLGTLGGTNSQAVAINKSGQVVGSSGTTGDTAYHAFLWEGTTLYDLNSLIDPTSGWVLTDANGINDGGQIAGAGTLNDEWHAFLLTPAAPVANKTVSIDIKPGSVFNRLNAKRKGTVSVAILSTKDFDASKQVDWKSLTFGRKGDETSLDYCYVRKANRDSRKDLVCEFYVSRTGFQCGDTQGVLKGKTLDGTPIEGRDSIRIVRCKCKCSPKAHYHGHRGWVKNAACDTWNEEEND